MRVSARPVLRAPEVQAPAIFLRSASCDFWPGLAIRAHDTHCPARERSDMATPDKDSASRLDEWSPRLLKSRLYNRILVDIIIGVLAPGEQLDENVLSGRYGGGLAGIRE